MFARLHVSGLGPLEDLTIAAAPAGYTEIAGASECGKSTLVEALCLALWGVAGDGRPFPVEAIRDGCPRATIEATTARGTVLRRSLTRSRIQSRELGSGEDLQVFTREEDLAARLGPVGQRADLGRLVVVPFSWGPLLGRELGRPLRDLLLSALPSGDLRSEVARQMGSHSLRDSDPLDAAGAARLQTAANRSRDEARGRLDSAKARTTTAIPPAVVDQAAVETARGLLEAAAAWDAHQVAMDRHEAARRARATAEAARDDWRRRRAELGERPAWDQTDLRVATEKVRRLETDVANARQGHQDADLGHRDATRALEATRATFRDLRTAGDRCPTCERPGWTGAATKIEKAEAEGKRLSGVVANRLQVMEAAAEKLAALERDLIAARGELEVVERAGSEPRAWDAQMRALGPEPQVPMPATAPPGPKMARPELDQVEDARRVLRDAVEAEGARKRAAVEADRARAELAEATTEWERADREAQRVEILVAACRRAPSEIARAQAEAFGDLGPVEIRFPEKETKQTPEVEVLVDGRPWWLASTGRQVVADLWLRSAIRRLSGLAALPIVVDRTQDWSGDWPEVPGPVWFLRTTAGPLMTRVRP